MAVSRREDSGFSQPACLPPCPRRATDMRGEECWTSDVVGRHGQRETQRSSVRRPGGSAPPAPTGGATHDRARKGSERSRRQNVSQ